MWRSCRRGEGKSLTAWFMFGCHIRHGSIWLIENYAPSDLPFFLKSPTLAQPVSSPGIPWNLEQTRQVLLWTPPPTLPSGCRIKVWPFFDKLVNKNFDHRHLSISLASNLARKKARQHATLSKKKRKKHYLVCVLTVCSYWLVEYCLVPLMPCEEEESLIVFEDFSDYLSSFPHSALRYRCLVLLLLINITRNILTSDFPSLRSRYFVG